MLLLPYTERATAGLDNKAKKVLLGTRSRQTMKQGGAWALAQVGEALQGVVGEREADMTVREEREVKVSSQSWVK